ncbi:hypothetical protein C2E25_09890 [Geothermobacter hydrogeniphilus]|uniref:Glycosyl transferase family 8 n=2 Tax=Geothermobacter hydrogeniphilus TaxID=1969733 RepID=A0A2K2H9R5_9BACT|nr:hypothetical protein C2E25_09890 [Geothermobacter hydrogeniphilus]
MSMKKKGANGLEKRAIVTIAIGTKFQKLASYTHPFLRSYADKCGAEFIVIDSPRLSDRLGLATYERFQLHDLLEDYDRIIYIDSDILVSPDSPDLFELVPAGVMGVSSEEKYSMSGRDKRLTMEILGEVAWKNPYFNAGMMVVGREHRELFDVNNPDLFLWATGEFRKKHVNLLNDQPFINHRVNKLGYDVVDLGFRYNHTRVITQTHLRFHSYFIHYAGPSGHRYGERSEQVRKDALVLDSRFRLGMSRKYPFYRWVADRLDVGFVAYLFREKLFN